MKKEDTYIVVLPNIKIQGFSDLTKKEITIASSPDKAVKNIFFRKISNVSHKKTMEIKATLEFNKFKRDIGNLEKYTYRIETNFEENGKNISRFDSHYKTIQEIFLAEEIARKNKYINSSQDYFKIARNLLSQ